MLTVAELKQFIYCPRIFYFMAVQSLHPPSTHLMERGHKLQDEFERLESRRVLSRYGLQQAHRHFSIQLADSDFDFCGQLDLLLEAPNRLAVVEFKASGAQLAENHRFQLAAYALLAERSFRKPCPAGFAIFVDRNEVEEILIGSQLRENVLLKLQEMRALLKTGLFPSPTPVRTRCTNCEYRNFCGDVF